MSGDKGSTDAVGRGSVTGAGSANAVGGVLPLPVLPEKPWFTKVAPKAGNIAPDAVTSSQAFVRTRPMPLPPLFPVKSVQAQAVAPSAGTVPVANVPSPASTSAPLPPATSASTGTDPVDASLATRQRLDFMTDRLERDLTILRREISRLQSDKRASDLELLESRRAARDCEMQLEKVKETISYQLGSALVESRQSVRGALGLPKRLKLVFRSSRALKERLARARADMPVAIARSAEAAHLVRAALVMADNVGTEQAVAWARGQGAKPAVLAQALLEVAQGLVAGQPLRASALGAEAIALDPGALRCKLLAFQLADFGHIRQAITLLDKAVVAGIAFNTSETRKSNRLRALLRMLESPPVIPAPGRGVPTAPGRRVLLVGRQTLANDASTIAQRFEDRAASIAAAGWDVNVAVLPAVSGGTVQRLAAPSTSNAAPARQYVHLSPVDQTGDAPDIYIPAAAQRLAAAAAGASLIHAEGTGVQGLVAAYAARAAGRPLVLEYNEFYDPHAPFPAGYERTELGQMELWMSLIAARAADMCIVASPALAEVLRGAGIDASRISVMPHRHAPMPADPSRRAALQERYALGDGPVIGVVRDLCDSYDTAALGDLVVALAPEFPTLKLLVVGQGRHSGGLRQRLAAHRLAERLVLIERPAAAELASYQSLLDVAVFTRRDGLRTQMVSSYEVSRAMAANRAIVAYGTADAATMIEDGATGLLCAPGDAAALAGKVRQVLLDRALAERIGAQAQEAYEAATHEQAAHTGLANLYQSLVEPLRPQAVA